MAGLHSLKILIADDNAHMRSILSAILKSAGAEAVREVGDGAEAFRALSVFPADIAVVDFNMAPLDGVAFTRLLRNSSDSPNPYLPVIMMTGHAERRRVNEARDAGVHEFVVKPLTARSVLARLDAVIFRPRPFIRTDDYFGPCRRRVNRPDYAGPWRRSEDQHFVNLD
jgi:two-component system chemotaxis response regulator CheY